MTTPSASGGTGAAVEPLSPGSPTGPDDGLRPAGWRIIAAKELGDNILSVRFYVLILIVGLAAVASVQSAAGQLTDAAPVASEVPSVFLRLFSISPDRIPSYTALVGFLGPLLGIAFGFDAINNERSQGTLPRLVAQPIHRDDVINGKFAAGLAVIALTLGLLTAIVAGLGLARLGIAPSATDVLRLVLFGLVAVAYVGVWLAFAILCSVLLQRPATSALVAIAAWLVFTIFSSLLVGLVADRIAPVGDNPTFEEVLANARAEERLSRLSPEQLYEETALVLLNPDVRSVSIVLPEQLDRAVPGVLPLPQSLLVVWQQAVALVALTVVIFAVAYIAFMRQEIRA